jgi:dephospho-CoA kinase
MVVIGLTGGIGTGKSAVARMLAELGAAVVDSDALAREVVAPGQPALAEIAAAFGPGVLAPDGSLDRRALGRIVFSDPAARRRLEAITHPRIREESARRVEAARAAGYGVCVCDVPLLYEVGYDALGLYDEIWVVTAPEEVQLARVRARDGLDEAAARARLAAQWPLALKVRRADRVIDNGGSLAETRRQVEAALAAVTSRS